MNYSMQKLMDDFVNRIGTDDLKMLEIVSLEVGFNYVFFLYKRTYGDYPTGDMFEALYEKFGTKLAA